MKLETEHQGTRRVLVVDAHRRPLAPCTPARARILMRQGKAAVLRYLPFTLILKTVVDPATTPPCVVSIDPGTQHTGLALTLQRAQRGPLVVWHAELKLRQREIRLRVAKRAMVRRARRGRKLRRRPARFLNRTKPSHWLPPSSEHVVARTTTVIARLQRYVKLSQVRIEHVQFDTGLLLQTVSDAEYQTLLRRIHLKEYLYAVHHGCVYCHGTSKDRRMEIDHVVPRSAGGSNSLVNLTLACHTCNQDKGARNIPLWSLSHVTKSSEWSQAIVTHAPKVWARHTKLIDAFVGQRYVQIAQGLADASNMNRLRRLLGDRICQQTGLMPDYYPAYMTHYRRILTDMPKDHWVDASLVGWFNSPLPHYEVKGSPLLLETKRHQSRQMVKMDKYGFPATRPKGPSRRHGIKSGDFVQCMRNLTAMLGYASLTNTNVALKDGKITRVFSARCIRVLQKA